MTIESVQENKIYPHADSLYECVEPPRTDSDPKETTMGSSTSTLVSTSSATIQPWVTPVSEVPGPVVLGGSPAPVQSTQRAVTKPAKQTNDAMECFSTDDPDLILQARQLMADVYLKRDFVSHSEITDEGVLSEESDPYGSHSTYYVVVPKNQKTVLATVRIIHYDIQKDENSFPVMKHKQDFDPQALEVLESAGIENLVEVSALARDKKLAASGTAALMLYKKIFVDACYDDDNGQKSLIMACNPVLFKTFSLLFGDSFMRLGPDLPYPGQVACPAILPVRAASINIAKASRDKKNPYRGVQEGVVQYFGAGANAHRLSEEILSALDTYGYGELLAKMKTNDWDDLAQREKQALKIVKRGAVIGKLKELVKRYRPELLAIIGLIAYTVARTGVVAESIAPVTHADWRIFLGIELATTAPYVWGMGDLARNANNDDYKTSRKVSAYALTGSAFVAPYAYLAAEGILHSEQAAIVAGGLLVLSIVPALIKQVRNKLEHRGTYLPRRRTRPHTPTGRLPRPATAN
jgi:hypothetical protein